MRKRSFLISLVLLTLVVLTGCSERSAKPQMSQLQMREIQTRYYETNDSNMVMKAALNALQDDDFIIKNANVDLGYISADREVDVEKKGDAFMAMLWSGSNARWNKNQHVEATINVSEYGEKVRVRANFKQKTLDNVGNISKIQSIYDQKYYQDFFSKMSKSIFIQKEGI